MEESVFLESYVYKTGVQSGHDFAYFAQVHVAHRERKVPFFALELHQVLVFQQGDGDGPGLYVYK